MTLLEFLVVVLYYILATFVVGFATFLAIAFLWSVVVWCKYLYKRLKK